METLKTLAPFISLALLSSFLFWARRGGGGTLGKKIRNSDRWALEDAIAEKKQELEELESLRGKYPLSS
ncbi:MAG: hypothetical protein M0R48_11005 [Candidatus Omnitrophica bacterium]|nr:hypothetical protein [Candidatus Omnitrophota bacterium]